MFCEFWDSGEHLLPSGPVKVPFLSVCGDEPVCALLKCAFFVFSRIFCVFRGGSNMVAFHAKVDGKCQALFQRCLRYRVDFPAFPSLFLSFPPFSSASLLLSHYLSFSLFLSLFFLFSKIVQQFSFTFSTFHFSSRFLVKATGLHVTPLSAMCPTRHRILRRTRHVVKEDFACFSAFLGTFNKGS